jgi:flagellar biosynthesis protein FlhB
LKHLFSRILVKLILIWSAKEPNPKLRVLQAFLWIAALATAFSAFFGRFALLVCLITVAMIFIDLYYSWKGRVGPR